MPVIQVKGKGIHVIEMNRGAEETVVLVHGMFSSLSLYYFHIAPALAKQFHVVLYDLKSHGMSEKIKGSGYDLTTMAADLTDLLDVLQLKQVHLAGYSFGALIALKAAIDYPERIKKLVVIEGPDPSDKVAMDIVDNYSKEFLIHYINTYTDEHTKTRMRDRQLERNHRMYEFLFHETSIRQDMENEMAFFRGSDIDGIRQPTLLIYGKDSKINSAGYVLSRKMPHASLVFLNGDHNVPVQEPAAVAAELGNFLTSAVEAKYTY